MQYFDLILVLLKILSSIVATSAKLGFPNVSPPFVMGDGLTGIDNAAGEVFPSASRLMCWWHMKKAFHDAAKWKEEPHSAVERKTTVAEVTLLQKAPNPTIFLRASQLMLALWRKRGLGPICDYFEEQWLTINPLW